MVSQECVHVLTPDCAIQVLFEENVDCTQTRTRNTDQVSIWYATSAHICTHEMSPLCAKFVLCTRRFGQLLNTSQMREEDGTATSC